MPRPKYRESMASLGPFGGRGNKIIVSINFRYPGIELLKQDGLASESPKSVKKRQKRNMPRILAWVTTVTNTTRVARRVYLVIHVMVESMPRQKRLPQPKP